jgi:hypothetical protein
MHKRVSLRFIKIIAVKIIKENKKTDSILSFLNKPLEEHLRLTPIIILILFWNKNTLDILVKFTQKIKPYLNSEWEFEQYAVLIALIPNRWYNLLISKQAVHNL